MLRGNKIRRLEDDIIILEIISEKCLKEIEFLRDIVIERHKEKIERNSYRNYYDYEFKKSLLIEMIDDVDMENGKCSFLKNNIVCYFVCFDFFLIFLILFDTKKINLR